MGQVALPVGAVVAGEVVDGAAVSAALRRLWRDVAFSSRDVVLGLANARVMARMTEMPAMPDNELRSSLQFHVQDLIPIPVDEAQLDFQVTDRFVTEAGEERVRLMLVAAQRQMIRTFLAAIGGANLVPTRIDLVPLALIRSLGNVDQWLPALAGETGTAPLEPQAAAAMERSEVIIGIGAGVTNVVVHQHGVPSFMRTVPSGGAAVTQALALHLGTGADEAEGLKRTAGGAGTELESATLTAIEPVVGEVVGSLDFFRSSSGPGGIERVLLAGGGSRLEPLRHALADQLSVPIEIGDPYHGLKIGKVGIDPGVVQQSRRRLRGRDRLGAVGCPTRPRRHAGSTFSRPRWRPSGPSSG